MLKNEPTLAIREVDVAENEPSKVWSAKSIICSWHTYPKKTFYRQDAPVPAGQHNPHGPGRSRTKSEMFEKCLLWKLRFYLRICLPESPSTRTLYEPWKNEKARKSSCSSAHVLLAWSNVATKIQLRRSSTPKTKQMRSNRRWVRKNASKITCTKNRSHLLLFPSHEGSKKVDGEDLLSSGRGNEKHAKKNTTTRSTYDGNLL